MNFFLFLVVWCKIGEVLFDIFVVFFVFEFQYLCLRIKFFNNFNLYGFGEYWDLFCFNIINYICMMWFQDLFVMFEGVNLYGSYFVYYEYRKMGIYGVFFFNFNGMDIKIDKNKLGQFFEYNIIGGVFDFYFMVGLILIDVVCQYVEVVGFFVMMLYWGLGYYNCRYGYCDIYEVVEVVYNYS